MVIEEKSRSAHGQDILPEEFHSISEAANFWDTHDSIDYEDMMKDVDTPLRTIKKVIYASTSYGSRNFK